MNRALEEKAKALAGWKAYVTNLPDPDASILIGACLSGLAEQIDVRFSQGHPQLLGLHASIDHLIRLNQKRWKKTLAVEISYSLEGQDIHFDLLLLFTEDSIRRLTHKINYLLS